MNAARYKLMLSYLPGMAAIVNSFQAPEVQRAVYEQLMEALNVRLEAESPGAGSASSTRKRSALDSPVRNAIRNNASPTDSDVVSPDVEIAHDLVEGESIHAMLERDPSLP